MHKIDKNFQFKKIGFVVLIVLSIGVGIFFFSKNLKSNSQTNTINNQINIKQTLMVGTCSLAEAGITEEDLQKLYDSYDDPFITHIRFALNNYLHGSNVGLNDAVKKGLNPKEFKDGLDNFDKSYYSSKFMVYQVNNQVVGGGKEISLIFIDKPNKMFTAWVYQLASGDYELRDFRDAGLTPEQMNQLANDYKCFFTDQRLRM